MCEQAIITIVDRDGDRFEIGPVSPGDPEGSLRFLAFHRGEGVFLTRKDIKRLRRFLKAAL